MQCYQQDLDSGDFTCDQSQRDAVDQTQALYEALISNDGVSNNIIGNLFARISAKQSRQIKGLYFWGGVGRGKTWIIDTFYDCLPLYF